MHLNRRQLFLQHQAQTSEAPLMLEIVGAEGNYLVGADGKKYLDLISGISVSSLGHGNAQVITAIQKQAEKHLHTMVYGELVQTPQVELASRLTALLPEKLNSVYLVNSGTEAVEGAMKLAKRYTRRSGFVAMTNAYHGSTQGALSLMNNEYYSAAYRPLLPQVRFMEQNNLEQLHLIDNTIAAVFVEPVQGEKGAMPCDSDFLHALANQCKKAGALLVFDEIQTGMGRCGTLFAFQHFGVVPDVLLLGKAFGGGMPLGAFVSAREKMQVLTQNPVLGHITTFGGHPVSAAAALAALECTVELLPQLNMEALTAPFLRLKEHPKVKDVTGLGLLLALDLGDFATCKSCIDNLLSLGVFSDWFLYAPQKLRLAPPLTISNEQINYAIEAIHKALDAN